jgi:DNA ligase-1
MLLFLRDGEVHTSSRGGGDYDIPATYIREDEYIKKLLSNNPDLILDGELYRHGWNLQKISGLARKETLEEDHKQLCYHCYDIVDESKTFKERVEMLNKFKKDCPEDSKLIIIEQRLIKGLDSIMAMHNEAVAAGYEGLVIKDPDKEYKCGARDNRALKIKEFEDAEFQILGLVEGLRDEDMCFLMQTEDGTQFKAKPIGDRALKQQYREHINEIIGKMGTVKFFG